MLGVWVGAKLANSPDVVRKYLGFALLPQVVSIGLLVIVGAQMNEFYPVISTIIMLSILVYEHSDQSLLRLQLVRLRNWWYG